MRYFTRSTACLAIISLQQCGLDKIAVATYLFSQPHSFLRFSKTFAIYGLLRAPHSRNPTAIRIPGLRPPCSCPLTRSVRATTVFAIYGLLRASHSRNPTAIRIPGLRPPCSCPLTRSVKKRRCMQACASLFTSRSYRSYRSDLKPITNSPNRLYILGL